jgi:hypothetical protein
LVEESAQTIQLLSEAIGGGGRGGWIEGTGPISVAMTLRQKGSLVIDFEAHGVGQEDNIEPFKIVWLYDRVRGGVPTARRARSRGISRRVLWASSEISGE